ncbi:Kinase, NEK [Giardia muris]|uniref:non-specific serine/threonine protein kinase n=1 Tax=Giardia muris TaxID=5742 RepID=A0A4Z1SRR2_GIAMU|nr:Kinase, NEK [Giardia muris]|eukprot:TNJ28592.1 Kinase, NEK [Giardia muris]
MARFTDLPAATFASRLHPIRILHTGVTGRVLLATDRQTEAEVVVKEFAYGRLDKVTRSIASNELTFLQGNGYRSTPTILCAFHDPEEEKGYVLMEYLSGGSLNHLIKSARTARARVSEEVVWRVLLGCLEALLDMHKPREGEVCVHRSIKPDNIVCSAEYGGYLIDFGLAKLQPLSEPLTSQCGSPAYMAPELLERKVYTDKVDIWALGACIYEVCTFVQLASHFTTESKGKEAKREASRPTYTQDRLCGLKLQPTLEGVDSRPYSLTLRYVLGAMLQVDPQLRSSALDIFHVPAVAAIRRAILHSGPDVIQFIVKYSASLSERYTVIRRLYKNKTGTHVVVRGQADGVFYGAREIRVESVDGDELMALVREFQLPRPEYHSIAAAVDWLYDIQSGRAYVIYNSKLLAFTKSEDEKPGLANHIFLDEYLRLQRGVRQQVPELVIWEVLLQLLQLLCWLSEECSIVLRYLSLEGILINPSTLSLLIFDFGMAVSGGRAAGRLGSAECMAPEVAMAREVVLGDPVDMGEVLSNDYYTASCDVWSLGCVIYRMMTFCSFHTRYYNRTRQRYGSLRNIAFDNQHVAAFNPYSSTLEALVRMMLVKRPEERASATRLLKTINLSWVADNIFGSPVQIEQRRLSAVYIMESVLVDTELFQEYVIVDGDGTQYICKVLRISCRDFYNQGFSPYIRGQVRMARLLTADVFVRAIDFFYDDTLGICIVYDCRPSESLGAMYRTRIASKQPFVEQEIWSIAAQCLTALSDAHSFNSNYLSLGCISLVNLSPESIFVDQDGTVRVYITGYAMEQNAPGQISAKFGGALPYSSPEKLALAGYPSLGIDGYTELNDIWAVGCIVYQLCTFGQQIFDYYAEHVVEILQARSLADHLAFLIDWSDELVDFLGELLTVQPALRPSADSLLRTEYIKTAILPYVGPFPIPLVSRSFRKQYLVLECFNAVVGLSKYRVVRITGVHDNDETEPRQCYMAREYRLNKLFPLSVSELCEELTAMRALSMNSYVERPYDSFVDGSLIYVVTEYAHDETLRGLLDAHTDAGIYVPERVVWAVASRTLYGLAEFQRQGYIYGALIPQNILLTSGPVYHTGPTSTEPDNTVICGAQESISEPDFSLYHNGNKTAGQTMSSLVRADLYTLLSDFSLVCRLGEQLSRNVAPQYDGYLAPEVLATRIAGAMQFSPSSDTWALGAVLFEVCFGLPFNEYLLQNEAVAASLATGQPLRVPSSVGLMTPSCYSSELVELLQTILVVDHARRPTPQEVLRKYSTRLDVFDAPCIPNFLFEPGLPCRSFGALFSVIETVSEDSQRGVKVIKARTRKGPQNTAQKTLQSMTGMSASSLANLSRLATMGSTAFMSTKQSAAEHRPVLPPKLLCTCYEVRITGINRSLIQHLLLVSLALNAYMAGTIVQFYDCFDDPEVGCFYLVVECCDEKNVGVLLQTLCQKQIGLSLDKFITICKQLCDGIEQIALNPVQITLFQRNTTTSLSSTRITLTPREERYSPHPLDGASDRAMTPAVMLSGELCPKPKRIVVSLSLCHGAIVPENILLSSSGIAKLGVTAGLLPTGSPISPVLSSTLGNGHRFGTVSLGLDAYSLGLCLYKLYTHRSYVQSGRPFSTQLSSDIPNYLKGVLNDKQHSNIVLFLQNLLLTEIESIQAFHNVRRILEPDLMDLPTEKPDPNCSFIQNSVGITLSERDLNASILHRPGLISLNVTVQHQSTPDPDRSLSLPIVSPPTHPVISQKGVSVSPAPKPLLQILSPIDDKPNESPETPRPNTRSETTTPINQTDQGMISTVLQEVKKYFRTSTLKSSYLFLQGDDSSMISSSQQKLVRPLNASIAAKQVFICNYIDILNIQSSQYRTRILKALQVQQKLDHKNIQQVIDVFFDKAEQKLCVILEYVTEYTVRDVLHIYLEEGRRVEEYVLWRVAYQLLDVLTYMHTFSESAEPHPCAHLALTPECIHFTATDGAQLDFRSLKLGGFTHLRFVREPVSDICNIDAYSSPAALHVRHGLASSYDPFAADCWAAGCILYEIACLKSFYGVHYDPRWDSFNNLPNLEVETGPEGRGYSAEFSELLSVIFNGEARARALLAFISGSEVIQVMTHFISKLPNRKLVDDYETLSVIGNTPIARVLKVRNLLTGQIFMCKEVSLALADQYVVSLVETEITMMRTLCHESVVPLVDHFYDAECVTAYIVTEYFTHGDVGSLLNRYAVRNEPIPEDIIWGIAYEALRALEYIHSPDKAEFEGKKVAHRKIQPSSLLLSRDGHVRLFDFGLSKVIGGSAIFVSAGTLGYMAPEVLQLQGTVWGPETAGYDELCDIWSLGAVLYELSTLKALHTRYPTLLETGEGFSGVTLTDFAQTTPKPYSESLGRFISLLLEPEPRKRRSARELLNYSDIRALWETPESSSVDGE